MPLVCLSKETGERIDITRYDKPRLQLKAADLVCPECKWPMILRIGEIRVSHFAHKPGANCEYGSGESMEHMFGKRFIGEWLRSKDESGFEVPVEFEWKIGKRRADVMQMFPTGWLVAHEVQLASITTAELEQRTHDYLIEGCDVIWYLGKAANTPANRRWVEESQGFVLILEFTNESERARRRISWGDNATILAARDLRIGDNFDH